MTRLQFRIHPDAHPLGGLGCHDHKLREEQQRYVPFGTQDKLSLQPQIVGNLDEIMLPCGLIIYLCTPTSNMAMHGCHVTFGDKNFVVSILGFFWDMVLPKFRETSLP
jgi:hypothetical protein